KTAVRRAAETLGRALTDQDRADLAASFQSALTTALVDRTGNAMRMVRVAIPHAAPTLVVAGGVAANRHIREALDAAAQSEGFHLVAPPLALCTDNAAMIA